MFRQTVFAAAGLLVLLGVAFAFDDEEGEQSVSQADLPRVVADKLKATFPTAKWVSGEKEIEDDAQTYDVEVEIDGIQLEVEFSAAGKILEIEVEHDADEPDDKDDDD